MKDYEEVVQDVLRRSVEEIGRNKKRQRMLLRGSCMIAALGIIIAVGVGMRFGRDSGGKENSAGQFATQEDAEILGAKDVVEGDFGMEGGRGGNTDIVPGGNPSGYDMISDERTDGEGKMESIKEDLHENFEPAQVEENSIITMPPMKMISSYQEKEKAVYCYAAPKEGEFFCSTPLKHAMEEYGEEVLYKVVVQLFCDGSVVEPESEEAKLEGERLAGLGYTVVWESYGDGEEVSQYIMLHATKKQLTKFDAGNQYGYMFRFFDEP
ncbi:MAG: hypothetical protein K2N63_15145 [Lachnospiraceae bacterium]|nr:hypothetical protein [Lachnospiraceae bacterium]